MFIEFSNSLSIRLSLAVMGGVFYGSLSYSIIISLDLPFELAIFAWVFIFLFYLGSRLLILFSGINTLYYSKEGKGISNHPYKGTSFYGTAQWVGKFYHYHDMAFFIFLVALSIVFLATLIIDGMDQRPFGETIKDLWFYYIPLPEK